MSNPLQPIDQLIVTIFSQTAYIKALERGSFKVSATLKEFGNAAIDKNIKQIVIDMAKCVGMDSTFMGVVAGLAFRLRQKNGGEIIMVELNSRTRGLLATLGLDHLVKAHMAGEMPAEFEQIFALDDSRLSGLPKEEPSREKQAKMMLEAHENLIELSPENLPRFKDVVTFLREDIEAMEEPPGAEEPKDNP